MFNKQLIPLSPLVLTHCCCIHVRSVIVFVNACIIIIKLPPTFYQRIFHRSRIHLLRLKQFKMRTTTLFLISLVLISALITSHNTSAAKFCQWKGGKCVDNDARGRYGRILACTKRFRRKSCQSKGHNCWCLDESTGSLLQ